MLYSPRRKNKMQDVCQRFLLWTLDVHIMCVTKRAYPKIEQHVAVTRCTVGVSLDDSGPQPAVAGVSNFGFKYATTAQN